LIKLQNRQHITQESSKAHITAHSFLPYK